MTKKKIRNIYTKEAFKRKAGVIQSTRRTKEKKKDSINEGLEDYKDETHKE